ncbi:hypothetical protein [Actinoplanes sp. N902-109]|uniref:hypothetical protein n=1 Tax=Actinoplanes sp. (strain N902-109) TaxID=649831 RepID=UPI00032960BB|nr:hypothetical protein [Actinoplanes sp. N902-109]AGL20082.1 hypothetical protein L083_6572 [Actinoplanes sp. N902-109]
MGDGRSPIPDPRSPIPDPPIAPAIDDEEMPARVLAGPVGRAVTMTGGLPTPE